MSWFHILGLGLSSSLSWTGLQIDHTWFYSFSHTDSITILLKQYDGGLQFDAPLRFMLKSQEVDLLWFAQKLCIDQQTVVNMQNSEEHYYKDANLTGIREAMKYTHIC